MMLRTLIAVPLIVLFSAPLTQMANAQALQAAQQHVAEKQNWKTLVWLAKGDKLMVTNTGTTAVHLKKSIVLMPDEMGLMLHTDTILPGETLQVMGACPHHLPLQKEVIINLPSSDVPHRLVLNH